MNDLAIKVDMVCKEYRLGAIGGATLREDVNRWIARLRGKEDPSLRIGQKQHLHNEKFLALDSVSLKVYKGERIGIIGHNGAGKSTLLKLLCRVTAPSSGTISYNGRISSMLEVGTGFHGELTGRENIFMNGAILGMTKKEIEQKLDDIIAFAEMEQFIDTPVKRYSSGMYVKLAFAIAAHLDNEILIMDEVLAVGDMKFQQKCLGKMNDSSSQDGKTVLYVSHNMNTIRQLCERCIVLSQGKVIFDGDVEKAIATYDEHNPNENLLKYDFKNLRRGSECNLKVRIDSLEILNVDSLIDKAETLRVKFDFECQFESRDVYMRIVILDRLGLAIGTFNPVEPLFFPKGQESYTASLALDQLLPGRYSMRIILYQVMNKAVDVIDNIKSTCFFEKSPSSILYNTEIKQALHGYFDFNPFDLKKTS